MSEPRVSVLLPNLNNRPFLEERLDTILAQDMDSWELIIVDNYSDDGAWEVFQDYAKRDDRIRISQAPREGMYANWNNCVRLARGEYVYIATSDDTMLPNALSYMADAMDKHPQCMVCHTPLIVIDEHGKELEGWWRTLPMVQYFGEWMDRPHIRRAPHDGVLHALLMTLYISITQLLIRRDVFDQVGLFKTDWGSKGDFEWEMRVSLLHDTLHMPQPVGTWRQHSTQATSAGTWSPEDAKKLLSMVSAAYEDAAARDRDDLLMGIPLSMLRYGYRRNIHVTRIHETHGGEKMLAMSRFLLEMPISFTRTVFRELARSTMGQPEPYEVLMARRFVERFKLSDHLVPVD